ncbi:MAG: helix-turn-helix transcriptional regulator [Bacteroidales bacterium]|nr:helix-turn-helix transcriptional regulator [Bacteroidales bacterium]
MSYIGKNIRKIRMSKKMTQTEFAELFDLKRTAVGSYEEGRAEPKIDTLIKIADYFKLSLDSLLRKELSINEIFRFREDLLQ